jgi:phage host-nuclease inhibitor protein Gam
MNIHFVKKQIIQILDNFNNYIASTEHYSKQIIEPFKYEIERLNIAIELYLEKHDDEELEHIYNVQIPNTLRQIYIFL